jgi:hypothetical protein
MAPFDVNADNPSEEVLTKVFVTFVQHIQAQAGRPGDALVKVFAFFVEFQTGIDIRIRPKRAALLKPDEGRGKLESSHT